MKIALVTIGYNLPGATARLIKSAQAGSAHQLHFIVFLHSRFPEKVAELAALAAHPDVELLDYGTNRGLAKSWNEGVLRAREQAADAIVVANEDIRLSPRDLDRLAEAAVHHRHAYLVTGRCYHDSEKQWSSSEYGCFVLNPIAWETLGAFDENFFPIYYEDSDYKRRAALAGLSPLLCPDTSIHHDGSASLKQPEVARQNQLTYAGNRHYYIRKWGGDGGSERYERPFDDQRFSFYIDPRVRDAPYPGLSRTDQHIVQL